MPNPSVNDLRKVYTDAFNKAMPQIVNTSEELHNAELASIDAGIRAVLRELNITTESINGHHNTSHTQPG